MIVSESEACLGGRMSGWETPRRAEEGRADQLSVAGVSSLARPRATVGPTPQVEVRGRGAEEV